MAAVIVGYIALASYDYNSLKPEIIAAVKKLTGRDLILTGDIRPKLALKPTLLVEDVALSNADWGTRPTMMTVKRFEIRMAVLPLLFAQVRVTRLLMVEPDLFFETDPSGRSNLEFTLPELPETLSVLPPIVPRIKFDAVIIRNGVFYYRDGRIRKTYTGRIETLRAKVPGLESAMSLAARVQFLERNVSLKGEVGAPAVLFDHKGAWPLNLFGNSAGVDFTVKGHNRNVAAFRDYNLHIRSKAKSQAEFERLLGWRGLPTIRPLATSFWLSDPGRGRFRFDNLIIQSGKQQISGAMELHTHRKRPYVAAHLVLKQLDLRRLLSAQSSKSGKPIDERPFRLILAEWTSFKVLGRIDADMAIEVRKLRLPGAFVNTLQGATRIDSGRLKATADALNMRYAKGVVSGSFTFNAGRQRPRLSAILNAKNIDLRSLVKTSKRMTKTAAKGRFSFQKEITKLVSPNTFGFLDADITLDARRVRIPKVSIDSMSMSAHLRDQQFKAIAKSLQTRHRKDAVSGSMTLTVAMGKRPHIVAKLSSKRFDLRPLLPRWANPVTWSGGTGTKVFSKKFISFAFLREVEAELDLNADRLLLYRFAFDNINMTASIKRGRLHIKPLNFKIGRGTGGGSVFIRDKRKEGAYIELNLRARRIDVDSMMAKLGTETPIEGQVDAECYLKSSGRSISGMMASMNGSVLLVMGRGKLYYKNMALFSGELTSALFRFLNAAKKKNYTELNCVWLSFMFATAWPGPTGSFWTTPRRRLPEEARSISKQRRSILYLILRRNTASVSKGWEKSA